MPELPEVENMVLSLRVLEKKAIKDIVLSDKKLRQELDKSLISGILNKKILKIYRLAKYVLIKTEGRRILIFHAGMSGRFELSKKGLENIGKHDHAVILFHEGDVLKFNDPRRFGLFLISDEDNYKRLSIFKDLGLDALSPEFNGAYLLNKLGRSTGSIKTALLNQKIVAGVGNIYASEGLFYAGISPFRSANSLKESELDKLVIALKYILSKAIILGGSTLKDYKKPNGEKGNFQDLFAAYGREGEDCYVGYSKWQDVVGLGNKNGEVYKGEDQGDKRSNKYLPKVYETNDITIKKEQCVAKILKVVISGRATFYCPACQR